MQAKGHSRGCVSRKAAETLAFRDLFPLALNFVSEKKSPRAASPRVIRYIFVDEKRRALQICRGHSPHARQTTRAFPLRLQICYASFIQSYIFVAPTKETAWNSAPRCDRRLIPSAAHL